jgi:hypothetical protein
MLPIALSLAGCSHSPSGEFDFGNPLDESKADQVHHAKILGDVDLNSHVDGRFTAARVYGFTFEAKAGGTITVGVSATAGSSSSDTAQGTPLDTVAAIYGPVSSDGKDPGPRLAYADDNADGSNGALPPVSIAEDGKYLIVLSTWNDPGNGPYTVNVGCAGTDFQCRRPVATQACDPTTRYIQGRDVIATETWSSCKVVLLENTVVQKGAVLTVSPGVTVQGNYIGTDDYGSVALQVDGSLQAIGTAALPINFTALSKGWQGIVLNGDSSTLKNVFVDKANIGVAVHGSNNTFANLDISVTDTAMALFQESTANTIDRVRITQTRDGISLSGDATITDSIIMGNGCMADSGCKQGSGVWGHAGQKRSQFFRALISGFTHGMYLDSYELEINDATIINNRRGVFVTGPDAGIHEDAQCPQSQVPPPPPPPATWNRYGYDPVFIRTDIVKNSEYGLKAQAPQFLVIEDSNVRDNGAGIILETDSLAPGSHISRSNIFGNGSGPVQVDSKHANGVLDISGNYWAQISDPQLSASWLVTHTFSKQCSWSTTQNSSGCTYNGGVNYTCGGLSCTWSSPYMTCWHSSTASSNWTGQLTFTGFSPTKLSAGPNTSACTDDVNAERQREGA